MTIDLKSILGQSSKATHLIYVYRRTIVMGCIIITDVP